MTKGNGKNFGASIGRGGSGGINSTSIDQGGAQGKPRPEYGAKGNRPVAGTPGPHRVGPVDSTSKSQACKSRG